MLQYSRLSSSSGASSSSAASGSRSRAASRLLASASRVADSAEHDVGERLGEDGGERDGVRRRSQRAGRSLERRVADEPAVGERLLDDDGHARLVSAPQRLAGRALVQVPGRLDRVEAPELHRPVDRLGLGRPARADADGDAGRAEGLQLLQHGAVVEHTAVRRRGMDLVQRQPVAEQRPRLLELPAQGAGVVVLDLGRVGGHLPARGVDVSPLRAHHHVGGATLVEPRPEELLGSAVGARRVQVPHPGRVRGIEDVKGAGAQRRDRSVLPQVLAVAEVEVAGPAERGEAEADPPRSRVAGPRGKHRRRLHRRRSLGHADIFGLPSALSVKWL